MRFHFGPIPETPGFVPELPWKPLKEPPPMMLQWVALPVAVMSGGIVGGLWAWLTPASRLSEVPSLGAWVLAAFVWLIPVHEAIHALVHPGRGLSDRTCIGMWLSRGLFYAHCHGPMSRDRFIAILIAPFMVLSILPLIGCALIGEVHLLSFTGSMVNALLACGDLLGVMLLLWQVPRNATIQNQSWRTYWRSEPLFADPSHT